MDEENYVYDAYDAYDDAYGYDASSSDDDEFTDEMGAVPTQKGKDKSPFEKINGATFSCNSKSLL